MAEKNWTNEQRLAFSSTSSDILVSAAAGSGKTAVLTERLIRKLTDASDPLDVDKMLVVTFTKDAANELKQRITDALSSAMAQDPSNKRLKRQYLLLSDAKITTIHGFCLDLLRSNYEILGLSPKVRVSDEAQTSLLMQQVADIVIDGYYSSLPGYDDIDDFAVFADNFITLQDSSLSEILIKTFQKLSSFPDGIDFLLKTANEYELAQSDFSHSLWGKCLYKNMADCFEFYYKVLSDACEAFADGDVFEDKYLPQFESDLNAVKDLLSAIQSGDHDKISDCLAGVSKIRLGAIKGELVDDKCLFYRSCRDGFHKMVIDYKSKFFTVRSNVLRATAVQSRDFVIKLHRFVSAFEKRFSFEKKRRGIIDFNDIERMAYSLLVDSDGSYTPLASELSEQYKEVCIDEYQDVNRLQDGIFKAITRTTHRFMVGDIKQSIYGFRGAEPEVFADYRRDKTVELISLMHNFRSDEPVINFANEACGALFTNYGTTVPYDESDMLRFAKGSSEKLPVEINVIDKKGAEIDGFENAEALHVANRISELINDGVKPSDIAILLRSTKNKSQIYEKALSDLGIKSKNKDQTDLFVNPEVLLLMSILNVVDNPTKDIHLASALKSPIYNITLSELASIRQSYKDGYLIDALRHYTEEHGFAKGEFFLSKLEEYRALINEPVDKLIWHILCDSGLLAYASRSTKDQKNGKANLMLLYEKARSFENGTFKGLYNFIRYINDIIDSSETIPSPAQRDEDDVVKIMSIHKSKGLQFKYVFLCNTASAFNESDSNDRIIIDSKLGTTLKLSDSTGLGTVDTVYRRVSSLGIKEQNHDEQIRILYVALTRAESKIIVTGTVKGADKLDALEHYREYSAYGNGYAFSKNSDFLSWILISQSIVKPNILFADDVMRKCSGTGKDTSAESSEISFDSHKTAQLVEEIKKRFSFVYPSDIAAKIPAKLSVSELYPSILDDYDDSAKLSENKKTRMRSPRFIDDSEARGAAIGTATHQFMQFCDFENLKTFGAESEIKRMTELGYLSSEISKLVNVRAIKRFAESRLFDTLLSSKNIRRELRFNVHLKASDFTQKDDTSSLNNETVLVQGIIDCLFEDENGDLCILDYKTDAVPNDMSTDDAIEMLITRHIAQLSYYAAACRTILGRDIDGIMLYSFALGRIIMIPKDRLIIH